MPTRPRQGKRKARAGTGLRPGELLSEYRQTTLRLPPDIFALLRRIAKHQDGRPQWRVLVDAIRDYGDKVLGKK